MIFLQTGGTHMTLTCMTRMKPSSNPTTRSAFCTAGCTRARQMFSRSREGNGTTFFQHQEITCQVATRTLHLGSCT